MICALTVESSYRKKIDNKPSLAAAPQRHYADDAHSGELLCCNHCFRVLIPSDRRHAIFTTTSPFDGTVRTHSIGVRQREFLPQSSAAHHIMLFAPLDTLNDSHNLTELTTLLTWENLFR